VKKKTQQVVVTKCDGTLERFSLPKLANCLSRVLRAQAYDARLASPLANAIAMHLQDWHDPAPPTAAYIYRCARSVLQQTGLTDVADVLATHRRLRQLRRRQVRVLDTDLARGAGQPWRKGALVETLQDAYGLRHGVARFLAGRIEEQVFLLEYHAVSRAFLRELVRNEVLAWGLSDEQPAPHPAGQSPVRQPDAGR
jgi:hypothetical protein